MTKIKTVYLISHTHTDIGYTDHQNSLFRQFAENIDQAIELCEATADYPPEAQYKWTCEVAGIVERYVQTRPSSQIDRLLKLNQDGRIAVAGMAYHWTPMLSPAGMVRSLYPAMRLRRDYGLQISSAMQCDVDGASWLWADLLPAIGINGLTLSINTHRGGRPLPEYNAFWWEGPGGNRLLTFNGPHYAYGIIFYGLGDIAHAEAALPAVLERLEQRDDYPYDFLYAQVTHPALVDNGPPYDVVSDFVRDWNASGRKPRMEFTTVDGFIAMLHERYAANAPTLRGDWADWWADGVASSAYETAVARTAESLLPGLDLLATQADEIDPALIEQAYQSLALYDEHTWGSFNSITQPYHPFTRAQFNRKAGFAYDGYTLTHELLARGGRQFARQHEQKPEGDVWKRWHPGTTPASDEKKRFLVINPLGWTRPLHTPLPPDGEGSAPYHFLDAHFINNYREGYPQSISREDANPDQPDLLQATLPPFSYQVIVPTPVRPADVGVGNGRIENQWYRIEIDPQTGGLRSWYDKELGRELTASDKAYQLGQYLYEWVDSDQDRLAIYAEDFTKEWYGDRIMDTPFRRQGATQVAIAPARSTSIDAMIEVFLQATGARSVRVRYSLPHHQKALHIDMVIDKEYESKAESVYVMFPFALKQPAFHLDLNGVPLTPEVEQLPGSCRDWYGVQRWAEVGDDDISIVLAPLDAPLVQVGGIQTGRWAEHLDASEATLASWPVQNHWSTNFQAGQNGELLFRYRLTSMNAYDSAAASRFAAEYLVPPIVVRVAGGSDEAGQFMTISPEGVADVHLKRADDGRGLIVRAFNLTAVSQQISVSFPMGGVTAVTACSPVEEDGKPLPIAKGVIQLEVPPRSLACARVQIAYLGS